MALTIGDNFKYQANKPNFERDSFTTLEAMKAYPETSIDDGHLSYCAETNKHYKFLSSNTVDETTGKWREFETGASISEDGVTGQVLTKTDDGYEWQDPQGSQEPQEPQETRIVLDEFSERKFFGEFSKVTGAPAIGWAGALFIDDFSSSEYRDFYCCMTYGQGIVIRHTYATGTYEYLNSFIADSSTTSSSYNLTNKMNSGGWGNYYNGSELPLVYISRCSSDSSYIHTYYAYKINRNVTPFKFEKVLTIKYTGSKLAAITSDITIDAEKKYLYVHGYKAGSANAITGTSIVMVFNLPEPGSSNTITLADSDILWEFEFFVNEAAQDLCVSGGRLYYPYGSKSVHGIAVIDAKTGEIIQNLDLANISTEFIVNPEPEGIALSNGNLYLNYHHADTNSNEVCLVEFALQGVKESLKIPTSQSESSVDIPNATQSTAGLMSAEDKAKLDGVSNNANNYTHPAGSTASKSLGLYKISTDSTSHVKSVSAVTKSDITGLGIPAQDTTYSNATSTASGLMSASDKEKLDSINVDNEAINVVADARALKGATMRFSGFVDGVTITQTGVNEWDSVVYDTSINKFLAKKGTLSPTYHNIWSGMDAYMTDEVGTDILKDRLYLYGEDVYVWSNIEGTLVKVDKEIPNATQSTAGLMSTEDKAILDTNIALLDVTRVFHTGGTNGTEIYADLKAALNVIPPSSAYKKNIKFLTFKTSDATRELWQFDGIANDTAITFDDETKWHKVDPDMYWDLDFDSASNINSAKNNTRNKVPYYARKKGMILRYVTTVGEEYIEIYEGDSGIVGADYYNNFRRLTSYQTVFDFKKHEGVKGNDCLCIKEVYIDKYTEGASYKFIQGTISTNYPTGYFCLRETVGDTNADAYVKPILNENGISEITTNTFHAYIVFDWTKFDSTLGFVDRDIVFTESAKSVAFSPMIYAAINIAELRPIAQVGMGLKDELYAQLSIVYENLEEQAGSEYYTYNDIGLVHRAKSTETFNTIQLNLNSASEQIGAGSLIVKRGTSVSASGGTTLKEINMLAEELPSEGLLKIELDSTITLNAGEYLWVYFKSDVMVRIRVWGSNSTGSTREGMYFQGSINTYKYSTAMTLSVRDGALVSLNSRIEQIESELGIESGGESLFKEPLVAFVDDLYVPVGIKQKFFYNEFIYGDESTTDNTLNWRVQTKINSSAVGTQCVADEEGFTIYSNTAGDYILTISIYDSKKNLVWKGTVNLHIYQPQSITGKSILMLGDSWTDLNSGEKGYTPYINKALLELGISMNFIGTRDAGTSGLKHEGIGGYSWKGFASSGEANPLWNTATNKLDFTHYRRDLCGLSTQLDYCNIQLGVNDSMGSLKTTNSDWRSTLDSVNSVIDAILADSPNCKISINLVGMDAPSSTAWSGLYGISSSSKRIYQVNSYYLRTYISELLRERPDYNTNVYLGQSVLGINRWHGYLHYDAREIYCKVSLTDTEKAELKAYNFQSSNPFARIKDAAGNTILDNTNIVRYDRRGYIVLRKWPGNWDTYDQEFITKAEELPISGTIELHKTTTGIPTTMNFSECRQVDDKLAEHTFTNATHPADYGYRQMAYCTANQIAYLLNK